MRVARSAFPAKRALTRGMRARQAQQRRQEIDRELDWRSRTLGPTTGVDVIADEELLPALIANRDNELLTFHEGCFRGLARRDCTRPVPTLADAETVCAGCHRPLYEHGGRS